MTDNKIIDIFNKFPTTYHITNFDEDMKILYCEITGKKLMPEKFEHVLTRCSEKCNNWIDVINQWYVIDHEEKLNDDDDDNDFEDNCICSHPIHEVFVVKNKLNQNILQIGKECIHKFCNENIDLYETRLYYIAVKRQNKATFYRMCKSCFNCRVSNTKPFYIHLCNKCDAENNEVRQIFQRVCKTCNQKKIHSDIECDKCDECFHENNYRRCINCHLLNINIEEPEWKEKCKNCYIENKNQYFRHTKIERTDNDNNNNNSRNIYHMGISQIDKCQMEVLNEINMKIIEYDKTPQYEVKAIYLEYQKHLNSLINELYKKHHFIHCSDPEQIKNIYIKLTNNLLYLKLLSEYNINIYIDNNEQQLNIDNLKNQIKENFNSTTNAMYKIICENKNIINDNINEIISNHVLKIY